MKARLTLHLMVVIGILYSLSAIGQIKHDTIVKINGEKLAVTITNLNETSIVFSYPGETLTNSLTKNLISEIRFASGRNEKFSEKVIISGLGDWEKVVLTSNEADVVGLIKKGILNEHITDLGPIYTPAKKSNEKLKKRIKEEAAKLGAHIVLLIPSDNAEGFNMSGFAYGY